MVVCRSSIWNHVFAVLELRSSFRRTRFRAFHDRKINRDYLGRGITLWGHSIAGRQSRRAGQEPFAGTRLG